MVHTHQLCGQTGSAEAEESQSAYLSSIAHAEPGHDGTVRHQLRPEIGDGTIEVTTLRRGLSLVRYDVEFSRTHRLAYRFPGDHFELEHCLDGRMRIRESGSTGEMRASAVSLSPRGALDGVVEYEPGERYRAVSVTGTWTGVESYLRDLGAYSLPAIGPEPVARERYLGRSTALLPAADPLREIFAQRRDSAGRLLFLESRLLAALAAVTDGLAAKPAEPELAAHEAAALRRVPDLLWQHRHDPPTLAQLARMSAMSVRRLTTGFRALYGIPVMEHHRRRCLDRAATLLVETDWPIARIASEVGYASASNFGYAFRRDRGSSPARFRRART
ncbi:helix-turn-helix transcriptional regulator [Amycolatopsis sp. VS8301801F10]|uniref:helix-turn-helix transcriptional regulator n=1 Tax=Amycolatopsis sp. VS8301801F10 TaxID=2652442 RepID=UPI0038FC1F50